MISPRVSSLSLLSRSSTRPFPHARRMAKIGFLLGVGLLSMSVGRYALAVDKGTILTVAGTGKYGYSDDNGPATAADLNFPSGIVLDAFGNTFFSEAGDGRLREVLSNRTLITLAGKKGSDDDTLPPPLQPYQVTQDFDGNVYYVDVLEKRVKQINTQGIVTNIAGSGEWGFSGDGGSALSAKLDHPEGLAIDSNGNLFIADTVNSRIRKVDKGGTITTVAGNGSFGFTGDNGPATQAALFNPKGLALDITGNLYVADLDNNRVRRISAQGNITTVVGGGFARGSGVTATEAALDGPTGVTVDSVGNLFVADWRGHHVYRIDTNGQLFIVAGQSAAGFSGDDGPSVNAALDHPYGLAIDGVGNLFITDQYNNRVREVTGIASAGLVSGRLFPLLGDVNKDGVIDLLDATRALQAAVGNVTLTAAQQAQADINHNGKVDIGDVIVILTRALGIS